MGLWTTYKVKCSEFTFIFKTIFLEYDDESVKLTCFLSSNQ